MIGVLGGGIAGISAGYHLNELGLENKVFEKRARWGGLLDNFTINDEYTFDYFVHLSFTKSEIVKKLFSESSDYINHNPESTNYYKGYWLKHPAQNNLASLSTDEKVRIIADFASKPYNENPKDYYEWLLYQFGEYFVENFSEVYTKKYWTVSAKDLTTDWLGGRFSLPSFDNLLKGAFEEQQENFYYAKEMRYPVKGGYKSFLNKMASNANIALNKEVELIDVNQKKIHFSDNTTEHYEHLVSSIPLPELVKRIKDVPKHVVEASEKLLYTSGQLVSLGFNDPDIAKYLWFYIYDEDIYPSRAYAPSLKSPNNVPEGKSSLQFETYYSKYLPKKLSGGALIEHVLQKGEKMGVWSKGDIDVADYREQKFANVVFDKLRLKNRFIVQSYLDSQNIKYIGRFGEWDYLWSDQSLLSGRKCAYEFV
jgi:protoporphyrinogen oxidase